MAGRYNAAQLRQWVFDARVLHPDTQMPPFGTLAGIVQPIEPKPILTPAQIDDVAAALATLGAR
ncbi:MAG: hypothetical protein MO853_09545 [Candidatus Protistobacter heckmanni]|nr:hypothetical protein [Candidatus Protistobacter heckmanni]